MLGNNANKKQKIVDLIKDCVPVAPPEPPPAKPMCTYGGTVFNIHPGATIGPITTIHLYPDPKKGTHGD